MRFYLNSLYHRCCNYHFVGGANKLRDILKEIGFGDLLEPVEILLATALDKTTFGEIDGSEIERLCDFTRQGSEVQILSRLPMVSKR